ncbi:MAG: FecR family protein [Woeseiaceae bacterium]|jgi:ferric-dicitrate binding protein FerR (iron transport regulator)|nr:FecR family protein [Woeseiaceae bacterium]
MSKSDNNETNIDRDEETMARLLKAAGSRSPVPADAENRVYENVLREWETATRKPDGAKVYEFVRREWENESRDKRGVRRWVMPLAMAATVLLAVAVLLQPTPDAPAPVAVGTVARVSGAAGLVPGQAVYAGDTITTDASQGVSILLGSAESIRLDRDTTLDIDARGRFTLVAGRVYADTGDYMYNDRQLTIDTPLGVVTDVGTQFAVDVSGERLDVAVREGRVDVAQDGTEWVAVAGERLRIRADGATVDTLAASDPYWAWASRLAPAFDIEGKSLLEFLRWAARETGRELVFESNELRMSAMRVDLHGSVADFEPIDAVESVLAGTRFRYRIDANRIVIESPLQ